MTSAATAQMTAEKMWKKDYLPSEAILWLSGNISIQQHTNIFALISYHFNMRLRPKSFQRLRFGRAGLKFAAEWGDVETAEGSLGLLRPLHRRLNVVKNMRTSFSLAVEWGNSEIVELFLRTVPEHLDLNGRDKYGDPPLHLAAKWGHTEIVRILLATGKVDVNIKNAYRATPLHVAASWGYVDIVRMLLLERKIEKDPRDYRLFTPLHLAAAWGQTRIVELLLDMHKVAPDPTAAFNIPFVTVRPLHSACVQGHTRIVELLLAAGVSRLDDQEHGRGTLHWAAWRGHTKVVKLLVGDRNVNLDSLDANGHTPLILAARQGHEGVVDVLLSSRRLHPSCFSKRDFEMEGGHDPKKTAEDLGIEDFEGEWETPLYVAARNGHQNIVKKLLQAGSHLFPGFDFEDAFSKKPLHSASAGGSVEALQYYIERGDDPNSEDSEGWTPMSFAAKWDRSWIIEYLVTIHHIDVNQKDGNDNTPLSLAAQWGCDRTVKFLLSLPEINVNVRDKKGLTPLAHAAIRGRMGVVRLMLQDARVNVLLIDNKGFTPDKWAKFYQNYELADLIYQHNRPN